MQGLMPFDPGAGVIVIALLLGLISAGFILRFVWPAWRLGRSLDRACIQLAELQAQKEHGQIDIGHIGQTVFRETLFAHLWREYAQTLHRLVNAQPATNAPSGWRATAMAETFFTEQALVDIPLQSEFYKHLPGILTGLGIIGTFTGLIAGLTHFEVSNDPETVRHSLRALIQGVGHAFKVSAVAIALAMLTTWIEKTLIAARYRQVARLVQLIDSLFEGGVGETYLSRLVKASETQANIGSSIGHQIAVEVRSALTEGLLQLQKTQSQHQASIAGAVADAVAMTLKEPMTRIAEHLERLSKTQGSQMEAALQQALTQFHAQFSRGLDTRQTDLEHLMSQTASALQQAVSELRRVALQLENAGKGSVEAAASRLDQAGNGIGAASQTFAGASSALNEAASVLREASRHAASALSEHRVARDDFARMLSELHETVRVARHEAGISAEILTRIDNAAAKLTFAGREAEQYLQGINAVMTESHAAFARNVENTLHLSNVQFQRELATAIEYLRSSIEALGETLEGLTTERSA